MAARARGGERISETRAAVLWIALLTAASAVTTWALACSTPFAALAALAAVHMRRHDGLALVGLCWLSGQVVGFAVLGYPHDPKTIAWAFGIGAAAMASALAAQVVPGRSHMVRLAGAFVAAFMAYNGVLALCALVLGGIGITLDPANLATQFGRNGAILIGLYGLYRAALAAGLPAPARRLAPA